MMEAEDVGSIPVVENDRLVGIVTDRDIVVRAIAKGKDPKGMPASAISTRELATVGPDDDLWTRSSSWCDIRSGAWR